MPYVAPEILREGARRATPAVDVYGMALVAYEVVTGCRAMVAESMPQLVDRLLWGPPPRAVAELRPDAPAALVRLIEAGLQRDPAARPRDAAEFGRAMASAAR
ncbi:MAG: hypothetical protein AB1Z98_17360 [Nannocystaceae bacterium]